MAGKIKMLLVEDNEDERFFMKEGLIQTGLYEIVGEAEDGDQMIELLNSRSFSFPDIILSDLNMPGRNGYDVITHIKTNNHLSHIPVIILTTAPLKPYAERCKKLGACAYYTKPDTFLEYKEFGEKVYEELKTCIAEAKLNYSVIRKMNGSFFRFLDLGVVQFFISLMKKSNGTHVKIEAI
jgi:CheY-like chemotaxis protein